VVDFRSPKGPIWFVNVQDDELGEDDFLLKAESEAQARSRVKDYVKGKYARGLPAASIKRVDRMSATEIRETTGASEVSDLGRYGFVELFS